MASLAEVPDPLLTQVINMLAGVQLELDAERTRRQDLQAVLDRILTSMSDAVLETDPRGIIVRANDAATSLLDPGRSLVGRPVATVLEPDVPATPWQLLTLAPEGGLVVETSLRRADGRGVPVSLSCAVVRETTGRIGGAIYAARDLTETERLLTALEEARARWRLLAEVAAGLVEEPDPRQALGDVVARFAAFVGCGVAIVLVDGTVVDDLVLSGDGAPGAEELRALVGRPVPAGTALAAAIQRGQTVHARSPTPGYPLLSPAPLRRPPAAAAVVPVAARDRHLGALVLLAEDQRLADGAVDLAEHVANGVAVALVNAALRASVSQLERAHEMARFRQELLAGLSHDMKTPLEVITGTIETIRDMGEELPAGAIDALYGAIANQARRLRRLVVQFLDYTRLESGQPVTVNPAPMELGPAVEAVVASFAGHTTFDVHLPDDLPRVVADADRVDQVLSNLIGNALKFSRAGEPIEVTARAAGAEVEVTVADRGPGISASDQAYLFDKFHRSGTAKGTDGTGVGLYMSRALMAAQGGRISVASRVGEGSRFSIWLPVAAEAETAE